MRRKAVPVTAAQHNNRSKVLVNERYYRVTYEYTIENSRMYLYVYGAESYRQALLAVVKHTFPLRYVGVVEHELKEEIRIALTIAQTDLADYLTWLASLLDLL